jgi:hypothetical protein
MNFLVSSFAFCVSNWLLLAESGSEPTRDEMATGAVTLGWAIGVASAFLLGVQAFFWLRMQFAKGHTVRVEQPVITGKAKEYAERSELNALSLEMKNFMTKMENISAEEARAGTTSRKEVYRRLDDHNAKIAAVGKEVEITRQQLLHIDGKLDRLIERPA